MTSRQRSHRYTLTASCQLKAARYIYGVQSQGRTWTGSKIESIRCDNISEYKALTDEYSRDYCI